jgi:SPOR domain
MTLDTHPTMDLDVERRLGGVGPFVINLEASTAPMGVPAKSPAGSEQARLYRIQRVDDGRIRYRLRLGPFATEDEAEATLAKVRLEYPCALLVTAATDDLHAIALVRGKTHSGDSPLDTQATDVVPPSVVVDTRQSAAPITAAAPATVPAPAITAAAPVIAPAAPVPAPAKAVAAVAVATVPVPAKALAIAAAAPAIAVAIAAVAPAPAIAVAIVTMAPVLAPELKLELAPQRPVVSVASDIASMQALMAAIDTGSNAAPSNLTTKPSILYTVPAARRDELQPAAPKVTARRDDAGAGTSIPSLESTQTLRPLTPLELGQHEAPRWFVVQLALSDDAFDPDALPHLDIFSLYRLYTVIGLDQGRLVHALRLGFFGEDVGARAVAGYLAAFYDAPIIKRVSVAERDRFADQRVEARKDVGATGRHLAIEITDELVVRGRRSSR